MTRKLFFVLGLLALLSTALVGVSYSAWSEDLLITGTVATGTLDAIFANGESELNPDNGGAGSCVAANADPHHTLGVAIGDIYDGFTCHIPMAVQNPGTIPMKVSVPARSWTVPSGSAPDGVSVELDDCWTGTVLLAAGASTATADPACRISVHVGASVEEGADYNFYYDFVATPFNE